MRAATRAGENLSQVLAVSRDLEAWGAQRGWTGSDPYDALNTRMPLRALRFPALGLRAFTQLVKQSPVNLRPLLRIPPGLSAATLAHVIASYARNGFLHASEAETKLAQAIERLDTLRSPGFDERCWGYHFDVQTRFFFYPRTAPNTIATAFAGLALLDAYACTGDDAVLRMAETAGNFFLAHIPQTETSEGAYFGYLVGDRTPIHNANMLACALLARLAARLDRPDMDRAARSGVAYTVALQRSDGSWPYSEQPGLGWVDNFHTGYVLDCLATCAAAGIAGATRAWHRGLHFYRSHLFLPDGTPKYRPDLTYPIDGQCAAQAIQSFSIASRHEPERVADARSVFRFAVRAMRRADGAFCFQRRRRWVNRTPHMRWVQAPMLAALTHLIAAEEAAA